MTPMAPAPQQGGKLPLYSFNYCFSNCLLPGGMLAGMASTMMQVRTIVFSLSLSILLLLFLDIVSLTSFIRISLSRI